VIPRARLAAAVGLGLLVLAWLPLPYVADVYSTLVARGSNAVVDVIDRGWRVGVTFEPPETVRAWGTWNPTLVLVDRKLGRSLVERWDERTLSWLPVATFVALAAASTVFASRPWRRTALFWLLGLCAMAAITSGMIALGLAAPFAQHGALGDTLGLAVRTVHNVVAEPAMMYLIPAAVWFPLWHWCYRGRAHSR
jgi:hypothetical protein